MTAEVKTFITSHSGSILSRNGYGLYNGALPVTAGGAYIAGRR